MLDTVAVGTEWTVLLEEATREVFTMMLGCEVQSEAGTNYPEVSREPPAGEATRRPMIEVLFRDSTAAPDTGAEVTAVVGIAGELCGVFNFACGISAARMMAAKMLGVDETEAGDQQWDAIGEICNMVAGNFKSKLPGIGERCMLSVPTIVVGTNYRLRTVAGRRRLDYHFQVNQAQARVTLDLQR